MAYDSTQTSLEQIVEALGDAYYPVQGEPQFLTKWPESWTSDY